MNRKKRRAGALVATAALLSGCFSYVPAQLSAVPEGAKVRIHLTPTAQVEMTQRTGRRVEETVDGTITGRQQNQLLLDMPIAAQQEGFFRSDIARSVQVAEADVLGIDLRRFSGSRTALLLAGSAGGAAAIVLTILATSRNRGTNPGDGEEEFRIPLFSVRAP